MSNTYRGIIRSLTTDGAMVEVPTLAPGQAFGPCAFVGDLKCGVGDEVIVSSVGGIKEDLVVVGAIKTEVVEDLANGGDIDGSDNGIEESWIYPDPPPWEGLTGGGADLTDYFKVNDRTKHVPALGIYFPEVNGADPTGTLSSTNAINSLLEELGEGATIHLEGTYLIDAPIECRYSSQRIILTSSSSLVVPSGYAGDVIRVGNPGLSIRGVVIEGGGKLTEDGKSGGSATIPGLWTAVRLQGADRGVTACQIRGIQINWSGTALAYEVSGVGWVNGNIVEGIRVLYPRVLLDTVTPTSGIGYDGNSVTGLMGQYGNYTEYGVKNLTGRNWTFIDVSPWDIGHNPAAIGCEIAPSATNVRIFGGLLTWQNFVNNAGPNEVMVIDQSQPKPWESSEDFYPEDYGAVADGVADDRTPIQEAITAATAVGGRVVFTQGKVYGIGNQILVQNTDHVRIGGEGTVRMLPGNTQRGFLISNSSHITIEDIIVDCNKDESTGGGTGTSLWQGIYVSASNQNVSDITVRNVTVKDGFQRGIAMVASATYALSDILVEGCTISNVGDNGIHVNGHANIDKITPSDTTGIIVRDNRLSGIFGNGIQVFGASHVTVENNILDGTGSQGHGICFSTSGTDTWATDFSCTKNKVSGFAYAVGTSKWGIVASTSSTRFTLSDNIVTGCAGGITVDPEDGNFQDVRTDISATISGNVVRGTTDNNGLNVRMSENATITGNTVTGAALTGIALASSLHCSITGNTSTGNGSHGVAIFGVEPGSGGHTVGPNNSRDNTNEDLHNAEPPVPCVILPNRHTTTITPGSDIQDAVNTFNVVDLIGTHTLTSTLVVPAGKVLRGGTITTTTSGRMITLNSNSVLDGVTIDAPGSILGTTGAIETVGDGARIRNCRVTSTDRDAWHLAIQSTATDTQIINTEFDRCAVGVHVNPGVTGVTVQDCRFTDWTSRCISLNATTAGFTKVRIRDNEFGALSPDTTAAAPRVAVYIRSSNEAYRTQDVEISGNRLIGNGLAHSETSLGPADMLSLHRLEDARVCNNYLENPGEVGIHVGVGSQKVVVSDNIVLAADTTGIVIGEVTATYRTKEITVTDNIVMDSNQDRLGTLPDTVTGGISLRNVDQAVVTGNRSGNSEGLTTQGHGVKVVDSNNVEIGPNALSNNRLGEHYVENVTGLKWATSPLEVTKAVDTTINNSATSVTDPELTLQIEAGIGYDFEAMLVYESTSTADFRCAWDTPAVSQLEWIAMGLGVSSTGSTGDVEFARNVTGTSRPLGGSGAGTVALLKGTVTPGDGGTFALKWAQRVAEASNTILRAGSKIKLFRNNVN